MRSPAQRAIAQPARQAVALPRARFTSTRTAASAADRVQLGDSDLNVSGARGWRLSTSAAAAARADGHPWVITTPGLATSGSAASGTSPCMQPQPQSHHSHLFELH